MAEYKFRIWGEEKTVEAEDLEEAKRKAGIAPGDLYALEDDDDFNSKCLLSAITDDILFGS